MPKLATVGDTFAVRLRDKSYGACRIVWTRHDWRHTSVVGLDWFGKEPPTLGMLRRAPVLELTHPGYSGPFWVRILKGLHVPESYLEVGNVRPSKTELAFPLGDDWHDPAQVRRSSVWKAVDHTLYREHRFRNDAKYRATLAAKPQPGDVFAVPLGSRWGVGQIVAISGRIDEDSLAIRYWLTASSTLHPEAPSLGQALVGLGKAARLVSCRDLPPEGAVHLGNARLAVKVPEKVDVLGGWHSVLPQVPKRTPVAPVRVAAPPLTLATVEPGKLFAAWRGKVSPRELTITRKIFGRLVTALRRAKSPKSVATAIASAVQALNDADTFIETVEREDLCQALVALGQSAGMRSKQLQALIDRERDW